MSKERRWESGNENKKDEAYSKNGREGIQTENNKLFMLYSHANQMKQLTEDIKTLKQMIMNPRRN